VHPSWRLILRLSNPFVLRPCTLVGLKIWAQNKMFDSLQHSSLSVFMLLRYIKLHTQPTHPRGMLPVLQPMQLLCIPPQPQHPRCVTPGVCSRTYMCTCVRVHGNPATVSLIHEISPRVRRPGIQITGFRYLPRVRALGRVLALNCGSHGQNCRCCNSLTCTALLQNVIIYS
jgi:hypothetical protein